MGRGFHGYGYGLALHTPGLPVLIPTSAGLHSCISCFILLSYLSVVLIYSFKMSLYYLITYLLFCCFIIISKYIYIFVTFFIAFNYCMCFALLHQRRIQKKSQVKLWKEKKSSKTVKRQNYILLMYYTTSYDRPPWWPCLSHQEKGNFLLSNLRQLLLLSVAIFFLIFFQKFRK